MATRRLFDGALIEIGALPIVGGSSSNGSASGLFSTVTVSAADSTLAISSTASAGLVTVSVVSPVAGAFGGGGGNYPFVTVSVDNPTGAVTGTATTSGALATVSTSSAEATAYGDALPSALLADVTVSAMLPTVLADAVAGGAFAADSLLAGIGGDAIGTTAIAGALDSSGRVEIGGADATATGTASIVTGVGVSVIIASPGALAGGSATAIPDPAGFVRTIVQSGYGLAVNPLGKAISWTSKNTWARARVIRRSKARSTMAPVA